MPHPFMTAELVRQRRAGLDAESRNQRVVRQLQPRARTDPERGRFAATARTFARQSAPCWPAPPEPATYGGCHDNPPRAQWTEGRVSGMSAPRQDRVSVHLDPHNPGPLHSTSRKESG
jgi:hypothetical protein